MPVNKESNRKKLWYIILFFLISKIKLDNYYYVEYQIDLYTHNVLADLRFFRCLISISKWTTDPILLTATGYMEVFPIISNCCWNWTWNLLIISYRNAIQQNALSTVLCVITEQLRVNFWDLRTWRLHQLMGYSSQLSYQIFTIAHTAIIYIYIYICIIIMSCR